MMTLGRYSKLIKHTLLLSIVSGMQWASAAINGPAGYLYLPEVDNNTIAVIDTQLGTIAKRIPVGPIASRPAVLATTPDGKKIYVDNFGILPATVSVINRSTNAVKTVLVESTPLGAFTSADGKEIYLPEVGYTVEVMNTETDKVVRRFRFKDIPVAAISGPDGNMYVGFASGLLAVYNPITGAEIKHPIPTGGILTFWYSFTQDGKKLYTDTVNSIGVIDVANWKLVKTINTSRDGLYHVTNPGAFTSTLSPDGTKLYVTLFGDTDVMIIDVARDRVIGRIPTKGSTTGVTFSADGSRGYISDMNINLKTPLGETVLFGNLITIGILPPGQVIEFDPKTDAVTRIIPTNAGPGISAWLPKL